jgi:N-acetyl-gamma-glutamyl-phosphate/LysW-gamma-L-alpha-aminoadipyl-6-phosphate reductase
MASQRLRVSLVGGSGYAGGELLRLLLDHEGVEIAQVTAGRSAGKPLHQVHPHLRGRIDMRFARSDELSGCDLLFLALPHGEAQGQIERYASLAPRIVDLSADFRLSDPAHYEATYGEPHAAPNWLPRFRYGLPELHRGALGGASHASGVGCNATATLLAVLPAARAGWLAGQERVVADLKVGSSEAGRDATASSHHPVRAGVVRPFRMVGHRHEAEVRQALAHIEGLNVSMSISSVELVRGVAAAVHVWLKPGMSDRDFWNAYRGSYADEPFVRIIHDRQSLHRHPEPRLLQGTNFADVGWEYDPETGRAVLLSAIDNLGKGAAGTAVQTMNLMCGFPEVSGLRFGGMFP